MFNLKQKRLKKWNTHNALKETSECVRRIIRWPLMEP